jgi:hypothetical protein
MVNTVRVWKCPLCGGDCEPTGEVAGEEAESRSFFSQLAGAFAYPFQGQGLWMLVVAPPLLAAAEFAAHFVLFGFIGWLLLTAYMVAFMFKIVRHSATGEAEPPPWPDIGSDEIFRPLFLFVAASFVYFIPALIVLTTGGSTLVFLVLLAAGVFFLPMAITIVVMSNSFLALNPVLIVRSILRVPLEYLVVVTMSAVVFILRVSVDTGLQVQYDKHPLGFLVIAVLQSGVGLYFTMVQMRVLGVMFRANEEKLGWF